jgi:hypothetical protein
MKVAIVPNTQDHEDFAEFKYAIEVRGPNGELTQRWTYRNKSHAEECKKMIEEWFRPPVERGGRVIVTSLVIMLVPWAILAMACGK